MALYIGDLEDGYDEYNFKCRCEDCDEKDHVISNASDFMSAIVEQLYTDKPLDNEELERYLSEICSYLNVSIPEGSKLQIQRIAYKQNISKLTGKYE